MKEKYRHIYGPVPSRRLGRSLGIDLVPFKICTFDCIYCQLGLTTNKTTERKEYVPMIEILNELKKYLKENDRPDYITLSGSGEPTLNSRLGKIIDEIRAITNIPIAIITNSSLLHNPIVRQECAKADLVIPSLDAGDEDAFKRVNRPHPDITFNQIVSGLIEFRKIFSGKLWLEVLLVNGITATTGQVEKIKDISQKINPDKIQINTVVRPPAEEIALRVPDNELQEFCNMLGNKAEIIAPFSKLNKTSTVKQMEEKILALLARRPCSLEDISKGLGAHANETIKYVDHLFKENLIVDVRKNNHRFFILNKEPKRQKNEVS